MGVIGQGLLSHTVSTAKVFVPWDPKTVFGFTGRFTRPTHDTIRCHASTEWGVGDMKMAPRSRWRENEPDT